jgi:hypothetical protein
LIGRVAPIGPSARVGLIAQPFPSSDRSLTPCDVRSFRPGPTPLQSFSPTSRPPSYLGPTPCGFPGPSAASPALAPSEMGRPFPTSVPLSGFLNLSAVSWHALVCGLVSCHYRSWTSPFRAFPSRGSWFPLGPPAALQLSTARPRRQIRALISPGFLDAHARARLPDSPSTYGFPFPCVLPDSRRLVHSFPVHLGLVPRTRLARTASPTSQPYSPRESGHPLPSVPGREVAALLVFCPSEVLLVPRTLQPCPGIAPRELPAAEAPVRDPTDPTQAPNLPGRVRPPRRER